jgi:hypothetical protein
MSELAFDLEQDILRCWNVTTDLGEILDEVENGRLELHSAIEALRTYQTVYEMRFERTFRRFEDYNREAWEVRNRVRELEQNLGKPRNPTAGMGKKGKSKGQKEVDH